ncbi:hypothetical protein [Salana multivorans]
MSHSPSTLEDRLRALAPDPHHDLDPAGFAAARARIDAELAAERDHEAPGVVVLDPARTRRPQRRATRRILLGAAAAVGVGFVLVPGPGESAFATWSPTPDVISDEERAALIDACLGAHAGWAEDAAETDAWTASTIPVSEFVPVVAEQRGKWRYVQLVSAEVDPVHGWVPAADCLTGPDDILGISLGEMSLGALPGPQEARHCSGWGSWAYEYDGPIPWVATSVTGSQGVVGTAGGEIERVTVTFAGGPAVEASLSEPEVVAPGGPRYWAAWWPSERNGDTSFTVTGYLADGSVGSTEEVHWTTGIDPNPEEIEGAAGDS